MKDHKANCYLVNTGWSGGSYGVGKRMDIDITRKIIDSIHDGSMEKGEFENFEIFNIQIPKFVKGVDPNVLHPKKTWADKVLSIIINNFHISIHIIMIINIFHILVIF